uniref:Nardilysin-like n=1 Tax=Mesocestoides corti TaxID=53468 RepID=A0A5K3EHU4_MESCO
MELLAQTLEAQKQLAAQNAPGNEDAEEEEEGDEEEGEEDVQALSEHQSLADGPPADSADPVAQSTVEPEVQDEANEESMEAYNGEEEGEDEEEDEEDEEEKGEEMEEPAQQADTDPLTPALTKPCVLRIPFADTTEKRLAYNLAFSAMKYVSILERILDEVGFYGEYPDLREEEYLVLVTLYDYTARSYQLRTKTEADTEVLAPDENEPRPAKLAGRMFLHPPTSEFFQAVEKAVIEMSVHFAASVARIRVKEQVGSLRLLLPEDWRKAENLAENMPFYAWYNQLLGKSEVVLTWLKENNFTKVKGRLPNQTEYAEDEHCPDAFVFNTADRAVILESQIVRDRFMLEWNPPRRFTHE